jgi:hypothetical protein
LLTGDDERQVFQQQKRTKQLLDGAVSIMRNFEELLNNSVSATEMKSKVPEGWCFGSGRESQTVLNNDVSASGKRIDESCW